MPARTLRMRHVPALLEAQEAWGSWEPATAMTTIAASSSAQDCESCFFQALAGAHLHGGVVRPAARKLWGKPAVEALSKHLKQATAGLKAAHCT